MAFFRNAAQAIRSTAAFRTDQGIGCVFQPVSVVAGGGGLVYIGAARAARTGANTAGAEKHAKRGLRSPARLQRHVSARGDRVYALGASDDIERLSRQEQLIHDWVEVGRIPPPDSAKGREKIEHLTNLPEQKIKPSVSDLDDRQAMLYDLRVRLNYIQQDLATSV